MIRGQRCCTICTQIHEWFLVQNREVASIALLNRPLGKLALENGRRQNARYHCAASCKAR